jgi:hypothetical protein
MRDMTFAIFLQVVLWPAMEFVPSGAGRQSRRAAMCAGD